MSNVLSKMSVQNDMSPCIKSVTVSNNNGPRIGGLDESWCDIVAGGPTINVELEVDPGQFAVVKNALEKANKMSSDDKETWKELGIMHAVNECEGKNIGQKIENFLEKKKKKGEKAKEACKATAERYKIKHR